MKEKSQVSLEYLVVFSAFLSVLLLFLPLYSNLYNIALFALDVKQAKTFSQDIDFAVRELTVLAEGSEKTLTIKPLLEWQIESKANQFHVTIKSKELEREETIKTSLNSTLILYPITINKETSLQLKKEKGMVSVKHY
ncbi:MAG: hypothetical protein ABIE23_00855 [archaeon]|nr:hypothetical protein [Candidatus Micrarchaeota archaeon]